MADDDITQQQSDRVSEKERSVERTSERAACEATASLNDLLKRKKDALAEQKDSDWLADPKRAKFASLMLGRPEIFDPDAKDGQALVKGMDAGARGATAGDIVNVAGGAQAAQRAIQGTDSNDAQVDVRSKHDDTKSH